MEMVGARDLVSLFSVHQGGSFLGASEFELRIHNPIRFKRYAGMPASNLMNTSRSLGCPDTFETERSALRKWW